MAQNNTPPELTPEELAKMTEEANAAKSSKGKYEKMVEDQGNKTGKNKKPLLAKGTGYEITYNKK